jgi:hypothetical protein
LDDAVLTEDVRLVVYGAFANDGRAPDVEGLAVLLDTTADTIRARLRELAQARHLVLDGGDRVLMAHPFASIPLGFSVMGHRTLYWGGCAWDSFALPHLMTEEVDMLVATRCPGCGRALAWVVGREGPPEGEEVAHFLVPAARIWDDVVRSCGNQRLFCDGSCVDRWLAQTGHERGYVMDLATLWKLARGWYAGRLDRGYTRRDPASALDYFREVGLEGPFWGR